MEPQVPHGTCSLATQYFPATSFTLAFGPAALRALAATNGSASVGAAAHVGAAAASAAQGADNRSNVDVEMEGEAARETSEGRAVRSVPASAPECLNLRKVLDEAFASEASGKLDVQPVRRLVAALVNRVARHTKHGMGPPRLGVHACARGKEGCVFCRYDFPRDRWGRVGPRPFRMEKGRREGHWQAVFPRNDRLCNSYEEHVLLANMGNVDWRPCLNLWAVVQLSLIHI